MNSITTYPFGQVNGHIFNKFNVASIGHPYTRGDVIIGNDVWIGERALIKAGVHIGNGAVIGMGSIVTHDVLPYEIVGGNPAKHIRFRFENEVINKLEEMKWYDWDEKKLKEKASQIMNVNSFIEGE